MFESDYDYFERRAEEERAAAARSAHPAAREAHLALAGRYSDVAKATGASAPVDMRDTGVAG